MINYDFTRAIMLVKMARFLMARADQRGLTHGEKHYLIQTALSLLTEAHTLMTGEQALLYGENDIDEAHIPF